MRELCVSGFYQLLRGQWLLLLAGSLAVIFLAACSARKQGSVVNVAAKSVLSQLGNIEKNPAYKGDGGAAQVVITEGKAQILAAGEQTAYERAKEHALRNAVEQVLGVLLIGQTEVEAGTLIRDNIVAKSSGFVKQYQVLAETNVRQIKQLKLKAWVVKRDVEHDVLTQRILQQRAGFPRLLILVDAHSDGQVPLAPALKTLSAALSSALSAKQFQVLNQEVQTRALDQWQAGLASAEVRAAAAQQARAQFIVAATLSAVSNTLDNNHYFKKRALRSVNVEVALELYAAADGRVIFAQTAAASAVALNVTSAARMGATEVSAILATALVDTLLRYWDERLNEGSFYEIVISGLTITESAVLREHFTPRTIEGVLAVVDRGFASGTQTFTMHYLGRLQELATALAASGKLPFTLTLAAYSEARAQLEKR